MLLAVPLAFVQWKPQKVSLAHLSITAMSAILDVQGSLGFGAGHVIVRKTQFWPTLGLWSKGSGPGRDQLWEPWGGAKALQTLAPSGVQAEGVLGFGELKSDVGRCGLPRVGAEN